MKYFKAGIYWLITHFGGVEHWQLKEISVCKLLRTIFWSLVLLTIVTAFASITIYAFVLTFIATPLLLLYETYIGSIPFADTIHNTAGTFYLFTFMGILVYGIFGIRRLFVWYIQNRKQNANEFNNKSVKSAWLASIRDKVCYYVDIRSWKLK
jgi:hypothetical protein